ncbi:MAG: endolytic transglycosylase MltG [Jatrophihabitans sp.]|nr:MAG: endolytic transglycosylase MltG [Jatrophihabitans sp.]
MTEPRRPNPRLYADPGYDEPDDLLFRENDLFEDADEHGHRRHRRADRHAPPGRSRRRGVLTVLVLLAAAVVAAAAWVVVPKVSGLFAADDYAGQGSGSVTVVVSQGDTASDIANTLVKAGVVKSAQPFVDAAKTNPASSGIQPGTYRLRSHMSGAAALALILQPSSRCTGCDLIIPEGATVFEVEKGLDQKLGAGQAAAVHRAITDVSDLGVPLGYQAANGPLTSVEGFLYPATYTLDPKASPADLLQNMTGRFAEHDRATGFAQDAKALGLTPYQALIIASIAQAEAKYPDDMAKVVRVILNRLAAGRPLQIDATSRYGAMVNGADPSTVSYAQYDSPYNTYLHDGLPPTPISNPGPEALQAAVNPAAGGWMYYVNSDAEGHLFFTNDENAFAAAAAACRANNWGCG